MTSVQKAGISMISRLQNFFNTFINPQEGGGDAEPAQRMRLAVAVLLLEIALSDFETAQQEKQTIIDIVKGKFGLSEREADELISLAQEEHHASTDYFQFTRLINDHYDPKQKVALVESLWRVAFADGILHHYEEHVIRRLADLLHVSHTDFIASKHRVIESTRGSDCQ
jgi:uncharacterized tellurite resistance protein B-like protein